MLFVVNEAYFFVSHRLHLARALLQAGAEVHVAAPESHDWAPHGFTVDELRDQGCVFHPIRLSRKGENPLAEARTTWDLFWLMLRLRPVVVHLLTIKPILYGGIAARMLRIPVVVFGFTGLGQLFGDVSGWGRVRRFLASSMLRVSLRNRRSVAIVQNPEDSNSVSRAAPFATNRVFTVPGSGVDTREFPFRPIPVGRPVVLFAARLLWDKGVGIFVESARHLLGLGVDARFVIVGTTVDANPNSVPKSTLEGWVNEGVVEWWGFRRDMSDVISTCTVFCLPTVYREGVPKVLLEAAATGRPIVATDNRGCKEIVTDGQNGFLCKKFDVASVSASLSELISDRGMCVRMGREGYDIATKRFTVEAVVHATLAIYNHRLSELGVKLGSFDLRSGSTGN